MDERPDATTGRPLDADELPTRPVVPIPLTPAQELQGQSIEKVELTPGTVGEQPIVGTPMSAATPVPPSSPISARQTDETPEQLRGDIAKTRTELGSTLGTIEDRFKPSSVASGVKEQAQTAILDRARPALDAANSVKDRALPLAMQARDQAQERFEQAREQVLRLQEREDVQQITSIVRERAPLILGGLAALGGALWLVGKLRGSDDHDDYEEWVEYIDDDDLEEDRSARVQDTRMEMTLPAEVFISGNARRKGGK